MLLHTKGAGGTDKMNVIFYSDYLIRNATEHGDRTAVIAEDTSRNP